MQYYYYYNNRCSILNILNIAFQNYNNFFTICIKNKFTYDLSKYRPFPKKNVFLS